MTIKERFAALRRYFIAVLIAVPILIVLDMFLANKIPNIWIIVIDCFVILLVYVLWLLIVQKYRHHITKKRTEFLHKKKEQEKAEQERQRQEEIAKKEELQKEQTPTKIVQKQKRNYTNHKSKKHKKKK